MNNFFEFKFLNINKKVVSVPDTNKYLEIEYIFHRGACMIIPFLSDTEIVLIRQYRPVLGEYIYEFPAGTIEENETPIFCAKREIIEEIEYKANIWEDLGYIYLAPGYSTEKLYIFIARDLEKSTLYKKDPEEVIEVKIFDKNDIKNLLNNHQIKDSKTLSALGLIGWL